MRANCTRAFEAVERLSQASFGTSGVVSGEVRGARAPHRSADFRRWRGRVVALGERDCSAQRRNQKVIEETPAPGLSEDARAALFDAALRLGRAVKYQSAGTVEFIYDNDTGAFYFLEVNTRLAGGARGDRRGHRRRSGGVDGAAGGGRDGAAGSGGDSSARAARMQVRVYAEDPAKDFQPSAGRISLVAWPAGARVETWVESGTEVTPYYDPMLAKIIVHGEDRAAALGRMRAALAECRGGGHRDAISNTCARLWTMRAFAAGGITTSYLRGFDYRRRAVDVIEPATQTTVQDYPGRLGYWHVGVPPSGPMDALAFRIANRLVGNAEIAAGLEIAVTGSGAAVRVRHDDRADGRGLRRAARRRARCALWPAVRGEGGRRCSRWGRRRAAGARAYWRSRAASMCRSIWAARARSSWADSAGMRAACCARATCCTWERDPRPAARGPRLECAAGIQAPVGDRRALRAARRSRLLHAGRHRDVLLHGLEGALQLRPHRRTRLIGPKPEWARKDGGEAGLHPSNIHDNAYAVGTVDFTGDMPVILGPDGPSLGGFVCPATIAHAELWKMGQLRPGDAVRFRASRGRGAALDREMDAAIDRRLPPRMAVRPQPSDSPVLASRRRAWCAAPTATATCWSSTDPTCSI